MAKIKSKFKSFKSLKDTKKNIVFLPYKASMWDSLESIWKAAFEDKEYCNTYVIPIPYADLTPDRKVSKWHCEIDLFPKDVPVLDYKKFNLKKLKPDVIFIHNPYDNYNLVTSVDSSFYSANLKPLTKLLVYVPYYATTGIMSEGQKYMPSYDNSDYIIIQSEAMRPFFDPSIPAEKLQPLGSPKFDRVIQMCQNPPEIPEEWKEKINGKKVYFYNTSLNGLLQDTEKFLLKMRYVFETFKGRKDACLLWRPHPLTNATLGSMRQESQTAYSQLKNYFIENGIGIYDDTADIDKSIAISDVYIGDIGTSVTSLFGVAGKPSFFLNNNINALPSDSDKHNIFIRLFHPEGKDWIVIGNNLYNAQNHDNHYRFYCKLSEYSLAYHSHVLEIDGKVFVFPSVAQDILVIGDHKVERNIPLKKIQNGTGFNLFSEVIHVENDVFIVPNNYPYLIRLNINTEEIEYISGFDDFFVQPNPAEIYRNSYGIWNGKLLLASPNTRAILMVDIKTFEIQYITLPSQKPAKGGFISMVPDPDSDTFWLLPYVGKSITRLNMSDGTITEYFGIPKNFQCRMIPQGIVCDERPFSSAICDEDEVFLVPFWGNMFVRLNKKTGQMQEWKTPFEISFKIKNGYFVYNKIGVFRYSPDGNEIFFWNLADKQCYKFDLKSKSFDRIDITFDVKELEQYANGFKAPSEWFPYGCYEGVFQTLKNLLDDNLPGEKFDREKQLEIYEKLNTSMNGNAGEKIYQFVKQKLEEKRKS